MLSFVRVSRFRALGRAAVRSYHTFQNDTEPSIPATLVAMERPDGWRVGFYGSPNTVAALDTVPYQSTTVPSTPVEIQQKPSPAYGVSQWRSMRRGGSTSTPPTLTSCSLDYVEPEVSTLVLNELASIVPTHAKPGFYKTIVVDANTPKARLDELYTTIRSCLSRNEKNEVDPSCSVIGFDLQPRSVNLPIRTVQMAFTNHCIVWDVKNLGGIPTQFAALLEDANLIKVGFRIASLVARLHKDFHLVPRSYCDLTDIAEVLVTSTCSRRGLTLLSSRVLGHATPQIAMRARDWDTARLVQSRLRLPLALIPLICCRIVERLRDDAKTGPLLLRRFLRVVSVDEMASCGEGRIAYTTSPFATQAAVARMPIHLDRHQLGTTAPVAHTTVVRSSLTHIGYTHPTFSNLSMQGHREAFIMTPDETKRNDEH